MRRRIALIILLLTSLTIVFSILDTLFIASTKELEINVRRYAIEGNSTVISTFYLLFRPERHDICIRLDENNGLQIAVSVIILKKNGTQVLINYDSTLGKQVCTSFDIDDKILYGFIVSTLNSPNVVED